MLKALLAAGSISNADDPKWRSMSAQQAAQMLTAVGIDVSTLTEATVAAAISLAEGSQNPISKKAPVGTQSTEAPVTPKRSDHVVVLMTDAHYIARAFCTIRQLRDAGAYRGDVVLMLGPDVKLAPDQAARLEQDSIETLPVKRLLDNITIPASTCPGLPVKRRNGWSAYFYKTAVFSTYWKRWSVVLWIDSGMNILQPIAPFFPLAIAPGNKGMLMAHSNDYPYTNGWTFLNNGLCSTYAEPSQTAKDLRAVFPRLNQDHDEFQSTMMLFETSILKTETLAELTVMYRKYGNIVDNDQSIFTLYFHYKLGIWRKFPVETRLYDYLRRDGGNYAMLKDPPCSG